MRSSYGDAVDREEWRQAAGGVGERQVNSRRLPALRSGVRSIHYPVDRLVFVNKHGEERFAAPYPALRKRLFANRHFNFMRGEFERLLHERFTGRAAIRFNTSVAALGTTDRCVEVTLRDGATESVDVLVGADGVHAWVRRLAFGPTPPFTRELGYHMDLAARMSTWPGIARVVRRRMAAESVLGGVECP